MAKRTFIAFAVREVKKGNTVRVEPLDYDITDIEGATPEKALEAFMEQNEGGFADYEFPLHFAVCGFDGGMAGEAGVVIFKITKSGYRVEAA